MLSSLHTVKDGYSPQEFYISTGVQTRSSDLYSLAATFYHLITGTPPCNSQDRLAALAADEPDPYIPIPPRTPGYDRFFLGAIDKALSVFPRDRLQSATAWVEEIDQERRRKLMLDRARKDQEIEMTIHELTVQTNRELVQGGCQDGAQSGKAAGAHSLPGSDEIHRADGTARGQGQDKHETDRRRGSILLRLTAFVARLVWPFKRRSSRSVTR